MLNWKRVPWRQGDWTAEAKHSRLLISERHGGTLWCAQFFNDGGSAWSEAFDGPDKLENARKWCEERAKNKEKRSKNKA